MKRNKQTIAGNKNADTASSFNHKDFKVCRKDH